MSSIAEFYSRNLATETVKGLSQKAAQGGTISRAPIGYINIGLRDDCGREARAVQTDPERAELVAWAFQVFASGQWTTTQRIVNSSGGACPRCRHCGARPSPSDCRGCIGF